MRSLELSCSYEPWAINYGTLKALNHTAFKAFRVLCAHGGHVTFVGTCVKVCFFFFFDVTHSLVGRWMGRTHNHCFWAEGCGPRGFASNYGLFSSLFISRLKCSLGAPFSTWVWLKRLSERHSFQRTLAAAHAQTHTCAMQVHKHTRCSCCIIFFLWAHNALFAKPQLPKVQGPYSWFSGFKPDWLTALFL